MEIVSLGSNCAIAYQLKQMNLRNHAYPFDWAKISLNSLVKVLDNDFHRYHNISIKKYSTNHLSWDDNQPSYIVCNDYGITMAHELVNQDNIELYTLSLIRRIQRFKLLNTINKKIRFVRIETGNLTPTQLLTYNKLVFLLDELVLNYELVVISKNKPPNQKIIWHQLESFDENWWYPKLNWLKIFENDIEQID
jgi:hypothetical protein